MQVDRLHLQQQLLHRLRTDDKGALQEIFQDNYQKVCGAIFRLIKDSVIVEDLAQEVFFRIKKKIFILFIVIVFLVHDKIKNK